MHTRHMRRVAKAGARVHRSFSCFFPCAANLSSGNPSGSAGSSSFFHTELPEFCRNTPFHCKNTDEVKNRHFLSIWGRG